MKQYVFNTMIQAIIIGSVIWFIQLSLDIRTPPVVWCILAIIVAIVGIDFCKKQKVFA